MLKVVRAGDDPTAAFLAAAASESRKLAASPPLPGSAARRPAGQKDGEGAGDSGWCGCFGAPPPPSTRASQPANRHTAAGNAKGSGAGSAVKDQQAVARKVALTNAAQ